mgnify:CR=1 FL=1
MENTREEREERLSQIYTGEFRSGFHLFGIGSSDSPVSDTSILELARQAGVSRISRILEPGCGSGGVSRLLAKTFGCSVTGIDLVHYQLENARARMAEEKAGSRLSYIHDDIVEFDYEENAFDVALDVFAWVHVADWQDFFDKMYFTLKPGGGIMMYDAFVTAETSKETLSEIREKWYDPGICTVDACSRMLEKSGFHIVHCKEHRLEVSSCWQTGLDRLNAERVRLEKEWGSRVFQLFSDTIEFTLAAHEREELTAASIIARKE